MVAGLQSLAIYKSTYQVDYNFWAFCFLHLGFATVTNKAHYACGLLCGLRSQNMQCKMRWEFLVVKKGGKKIIQFYQFYSNCEALRQAVFSLFV
jgi:hypothetical protein